MGVPREGAAGDPLTTPVGPAGGALPVVADSGPDGKPLP